MMKIKNTKALFAAALITASVTVNADMDKHSSGSKSVNTPVSDLKYFDTGIGKKSGVGNLKAAPGFGNLSKGAHGTFIKMPAGFVSKIHSHTSEYYGVVISGVGVNYKPDGKQVKLPVGSYWSQKGGERHITKCISSNECIFFISQHDKFDDIADGEKM